MKPIPMRVLGAVLFLMTTAACQAPTETATTSAGPTTTTPPAPVIDAWERSRQCANEAERLATRVQREAAPYRGPKVIGWTNHYNRSDGRCYVEIGWSNPEAEKGAAPRFYRELFDAIEGLQLASHASQRLDADAQGIWCLVPDPTNPRNTTGVECPVAEKFIADRMTN
jgi:hypothetical protein